MYNKTQLKQMQSVVKRWFKDGGLQPRSEDKDTEMKEGYAYIDDSCISMIETTNKELRKALSGYSVMENKITGFKHSALINRKKLIDALKMLNNDRIEISLGEDDLFPIRIQDIKETKEVETSIIIAPCRDED